jgi:hypothetical protein
MNGRTTAKTNPLNQTKNGHYKLTLARKHGEYGGNFYTRHLKATTDS